MNILVSLGHWATLNAFFPLIKSDLNFLSFYQEIIDFKMLQSKRVENSKYSVLVL